MIGLYQRFAGGNRIQWRAHDLDRIAKRYGASASDLAGMVARYSSPGAADPSTVTLDASSGPEIKEATFVISTSSVDSYGDTINQNGWKLSRYRANPIVLWGHEQRSLPIGKAVNTRVENGKLVSTVQFDSDRHAKRVAAMVQRGVLRATSVGFMPGEWEFAKDPKRPYGIDFKAGHELCEFSVVNVPANQDCLLVSTSTASKAAIAELREIADRARRPQYWRAKDKLDEMRAKGWIT